MGTVVNFHGHCWMRCKRGDECTGCMFCDGGLVACTRCYGAEACLPTDCPGEAMSGSDMDAVMQGTVDYDVRRGGWVAGPKWKQHRRK